MDVKVVAINEVRKCEVFCAAASIIRNYQPNVEEDGSHVESFSGV